MRIGALRAAAGKGAAVDDDDDDMTSSGMGAFWFLHRPIVYLVF
jgi:hypothetical protein